jgi:hypothetical protein
MDEYIAFKSTLLGIIALHEGKTWVQVDNANNSLNLVVALQSRDPQWYAAMMNALTKEQNTELQQVFTIADQRTAAAGRLKRALVISHVLKYLT